MVMGIGGVPIYIGESANIYDRVNKQHHRERCWRRHGTGESIRYTLVPHHAKRKEVEQRSIDKWDPVCNKT
jgi:hypothetical protein